MLKMIVGLVIGVILTGVVFMGALSSTPATAQSEDSNPTETPSDIDNPETYREIISALLHEAGREIQDKDTDRFYQKLIQEYDLDETSSEIIPAEQSSLAEALPDINKINQKAISLPLQEAGKNIRDEEIARFYYKLLKDAGWEIEPD